MDRRRIMMASGTPEIERDWLKFDILTAGTVLWKCATGKERTISYRKNGGKWTKITSTTSGVSISVAKGDVLEFKGNNADYGGARSTSGQGSYFAGTASFNASGDISTMLGNSETLPADLALAHLFHSAKVVSAENLILPYTTLTTRCYNYMFYGCTSLTTAPELPATTLASYCYASMFRGCTALVNTPYRLPATTLASYCYGYMFYGCSKIIEAPYLPATTLVSNCYAAMFYNCSKLQYIRANFTTTPSSSYTSNWVTGVAAKGIFDKNGKTWSVTGVNGVPTGWLEYSGLAFIITATGTITWKLSNASGTAKTVSYSTDGITWTSITSTTDGVSISFSAGDVVLWKGEETQYATSPSYYSSFGGTAKFDAVGNIMSLLNNASSITYNYAFCGLFRGSRIVSASHLRFSTSTYSYCYSYMFYNCTSLTIAPELPATTLAAYCYYQMFSSCTSLTTAPELPATTLASGCYQSMFSGCTRLTTAPELPATTLATYCYSSMLSGCRSLTTAPELPATTLAYQCYQKMFSGCTSLTTAPELPATTLANNCYYYMFEGCTSLTTAPELPATTLASNCYYYMFYNCTSLTTAPELPATTLADYCYYNMFSGCTSLMAAPELPAQTLVNNCYGYMFQNCSSLNYVKALFRTTPGYNYTYNWLSGVAETGTFVKSVAAIWTTTGVSAVPTGWTVETNHDGTKVLTIESLVDNNTIFWYKSYSSAPTCYIYCAKGNANLTSFTPTTSGTVLATLNEGEKLYVVGNNASYSSSGTSCCFRATGEYKVYGNVMSLINNTNFESLDSFTSNYALSGLFYNSEYLTDASGLVLPATTLTSYCYYRMFEGCTSLIKAPELPATTLAERCYGYMFYRCTSLTTAPELPATTLASYCYYDMFFNCTSLTTAPLLPATTLASYCYYDMFLNCTALKRAPILPATTLADGCYWQMFNGCTSLTTAPVLPATTLPNSCYYYMFYGCTRLSSITCLATNISAYNCTKNWVSGVASSGTFTKAASMSGWTTGVNGIPSGWTVVNKI